MKRPCSGKLFSHDTLFGAYLLSYGIALSLSSDGKMIGYDVLRPEYWSEAELEKRLDWLRENKEHAIGRLVKEGWIDMTEEGE